MPYQQQLICLTIHAMLQSHDLQLSPLLTLDRISILTTLIIGQQTTIEN